MVAVSRLRRARDTMVAMAWIKIPAEHHALFLAALPRDPRVSTKRMFGSVVAMVGGHMAAGLFARSVMVRLGAEQQAEALALDGAEPFDPMGTGRPMRDTVLLPEDVMEEEGELRRWLGLAITHSAGLPRKEKRKPSPSPTRKPKPSPTRKPKPSPTRKPRPSPTRKPKPSPTRKPKPSPTRKPKPSPTRKPSSKSKPTPSRSRS